MEKLTHGPTVWSDAVPRRSSRLQLVIPPMYQRSDEMVTETLPASADSNHDVVVAELESAATSFSQSSTAAIEEEKTTTDDDIWPRCSTDMMEFQEQHIDDKIACQPPLESETVAVLTFVEQEQSQEDQNGDEDYGAPGYGRRDLTPRRTVKWTTKLTLALINACIKFCTEHHMTMMDVNSDDLDWDAWYGGISWPPGYEPRSKEACIVKIKKVHGYWHNPSGSLARVLRNALNRPPRVFGVGYRHREEEEEDDEQKLRPLRTIPTVARTHSAYDASKELEPSVQQLTRACMKADDAAAAAATAQEQSGVANQTPVGVTIALSDAVLDEYEEEEASRTAPLSARRRRMTVREPVVESAPPAKRPKLHEVLQMLQEAASYATLEQEDARVRLHDLYRQREELDGKIQSAECELEAKSIECKRIDMMLRIGTPRDD